MSKSLLDGLLNVQARLKVPKSQYNSFGKYSYRSCEDILEAVKPLLIENGLLLFLNDSIEKVEDRYYVKATATVTNGSESTSVSAYAREPDDKKGSDASQVTGACSSYARKYALNALFLIDDTKDADATNDHGKARKAGSPGGSRKPVAASAPGPVASVPPGRERLSEGQVSEMRSLLKETAATLGVSASVAMTRVLEETGVPEMGAEMASGDYRKVMLAMSKIVTGASGGEVDAG